MKHHLFAKFFSALMIVMLTWVVLPIHSVKVATCTTTATGTNWNDVAHWSGCGGGIPLAGDTVIIANATTVNVATASLSLLTINRGQTLTVQQNVNVNFNTTSDLIINGTLSFNNRHYLK